MRPGQLQPNELEIAVLERIAQDEPRLQGSFRALRVLSREYTGAGSYTTFLRDTPKQSDDLRPGLSSLLSVPGVPNGMGAVLWCRGTQPKCLELFTYGGEHWDGTFAGFSFDGTGAKQQL